MPRTRGAHSVEEAKKHMRTYAIVGVALMIGTGLTVWAAFINFGSREINIIAALVIASHQGLFGGRLFHAPHFREEIDLLGAGLHRFLFRRADVSDLAFHATTRV